MGKAEINIGFHFCFLVSSFLLLIIDPSLTFRARKENADNRPVLARLRGERFKVTGFNFSFQLSQFQLLFITCFPPFSTSQTGIATALPQGC